MVAEGLGDLGEAVPPRAGAGEGERLGARLLRARRLAGRLPGARRLPEIRFARVLVEAGRLPRIAVAQLESREARPGLALAEHAARPAHVARLEVGVAGADPVLRRGVPAREQYVGLRGFSEADREQADHEAGEVDREPQGRHAGQELRHGRNREVVGGRLPRGDPRELGTRRDDLVEVRRDKAAQAEEEKDRGGAHPLADRDATEIQGVSDEAQDEDDDERRPDLRRPVEAVVDERPREVVCRDVRARPVHHTDQPELGREREDERWKVVLPGSGGHGYLDYERSGPRAR